MAVDIFQAKTLALSGNFAGDYLWSNAGNWTGGVPSGTSTQVSIPAAVTSFDDIAGSGNTGLTIASLAFAGAGARVNVVAGSLTVTSLAAANAVLVADGFDVGAAVTVTVAAVTGAGATLQATGAGATLIDLAASDSGNTYIAKGSGLLSLKPAPAAGSSLSWSGLGTIALPGVVAGATNAATFTGLSAGDVLELPGTSVTAVTIAGGTLTAITSTGTYGFSHVTTSAPTPLGWTATADAATGLQAITFNTLDTFQNVMITRGGGFTDYLWDNPANWSSGAVPTGGSIAVAAAGVENIASLTVASLQLLPNSDFEATASTLTAGTLSLGSGARVFVDNFGSINVTSLIGTGAQLNATGGTIAILATTDIGETYTASRGGILQLAATSLNAASALTYGAVSGVFALSGLAAGATSPVPISGLAAGDGLELPGTSVKSVTIGAGSLSIVTSAGTFGFSSVAAPTPIGYTVSADTIRNLQQITFTALDTFQHVTPLASGPSSGNFGWSTAANWSNGAVPTGGDLAVPAGGVDDLASLALTSLHLAPAVFESAVGANLSVGTLTVGAQTNFSVINLIGNGGASTTVAALVGAGATLQAINPGGTLTLLGTTDPGETYAISAGGVLRLAAAPIAASTLSFFMQNAGTIALSGLVAGVTNSATLTGLDIGDVLEIPGAHLLASSFTATAISLTTDKGVFAFNKVGFTAPNPGVGGAAVDPATGLLAVTVACFAAGTSILTEHGETPVEALRPGVRVPTLAGRLAPITWVGHRHISLSRHPRPWDAQPVRISASAFGPGLPACDLRLSPDHAVYVDDVLVPVRHLVNGRTIVQEKVADVTYYHVELAAHDVLIVEGLHCESYLDTGNRSAFANGGAATTLHPDFARGVWAAKACANLVQDGPRLVSIRRRLLDVAQAIGHAMTDDPGLRVSAGGRTLPGRVEDGRWHVTVPPGTTSLRLVSRRWTPAHTRPDEQDTRTLGVAVAGLQFDGRAVPLDDARLSSGWLQVEDGENWRWTEGDAGLALAGVREVSFVVAMAGTYWVPKPTTRGCESSLQPDRNPIEI